MSLITRCPACRTSFRVVPDQLRLSQGWVRCGQCEAIFNASLHLLPEADPGPVPQSEPLAMPVAPVLRSPEAPAPEVDILLPEEPALLSQQPVSESVPEPVPEPGLDPEHKPVSPNEPAEPAAQELLQPSPPPISAVVEPISGSGGVDASAEPPVASFIREMPGKSVWQRTWVRVALGLVSLLLLGALALQWVIHERDRVAALVPQAKPILLQLCDLVGCVISPLRQIESIVIESASLTKLSGDKHSLSFVIRNTASIELAMPAIELTLTDSQDQPVVRRVLTALDLRAESNVIAANSEWATTIAVSVGGSAGVAAGAAGVADRFTGYRVLAFYP